MLTRVNADSYPEYNDPHLIAHLKEGSKTAYKEIYDRHWRAMYIHACKMLKDEDEAKDVIQELFLHLWINREQLEIRTSLKAYLYAGLRNRILNIFDSKQVRANYVTSLAAYFKEEHSLMEEVFQENELCTIIDREIANLPGKMKEVFELSRKSYLSHKEIAAKLQISDKTVKKQINNAIRILKVKISFLSILFFIIR